MQRYVDMATLSHLFKIPRGTLDRWASQENWPRITIDGRRYYDAKSAHRAVIAREQRTQAA